MDPLSMTTGVLALVTRSIGAVQTYSTYATKYQLADLSIAAVRTECASIRVALLQIQNLIPQQDGKGSDQRFDQFVLEEYKAVLSACSLTFSLLNETLQSLGLDGTNEKNQSDTPSKLRYLWKEPTMELIRQNIRGQACAITLLLTAFQSETIFKTHEIIKSQEVRRSLISVSNDAKSLRDSISVVPVEPPDLSTRGSAIGDEEFEFDDLVINSAAYRRAFAKQKTKTQLKDVQVASARHDMESNTQQMSLDHPSGVVSTKKSLVKESKPKGRTNEMDKPRFRVLALRLFGRNHAQATNPLQLLPGSMYVRALWDFNDGSPYILAFREGDVIRVLTQLESGWWDGVINGIRGWFPSNYCEAIYLEEAGKKLNKMEPRSEYSLED